MQLYNSGLSQPQKSMLDCAQLMKQIDYKQEDQVLAAQQIVGLIAVDGRRDSLD